MKFSFGLYCVLSKDQMTKYRLLPFKTDQASVAKLLLRLAEGERPWSSVLASSLFASLQFESDS